MSYEAWGEPDEMPEGWVSEDYAEERFVEGLVAMREMLARFVEQGGDAITAGSLRANWNPEWGPDPVAAADTSDGKEIPGNPKLNNAEAPPTSPSDSAEGE